MAEHHHPATGQAHGTHVHGTMDISEHEKMFAAFMKFWVYVFGSAIFILIFLALFNS